MFNMFKKEEVKLPIENANNPEPDKPKVLIHELKIYLEDNTTLSYSKKGLTTNSAVHPWRDFYKWFFAQPHRPYYAMPYRNENDSGEIIFRKATIKYFKALVYEENALDK